MIRSCTHISSCEYTGDIRLEHEWLPLEGPPFGTTVFLWQIDTCKDKAGIIALEYCRKRTGVRKSTYKTNIADAGSV